MIIDRFYYGQLNKKEQAIYRTFYDGVKSHKDIIPIPVKGTFTEEMFNRIFIAITRDNPLIYYLNQSACNIAKDMFGHIAICPQYFYSQEKVKEYNKKIENTVNSLATQIRLTEGNDYDKALKVHDWICKNIQYDEKGKDINEPVRVINSHNIIGVFANHKAQCEGIAKAVKVLLNAVDVKCIVATGETDCKRENGPHAWNIVKINNSPYHMDVTWDIGATEDKDTISYDYFNVSDELICVDHKTNEKLPKCRTMDMNYFTQNELVINSKVQLLEYINKSLISDKKDFYFRVENGISVENARKFLCETVSKYYSAKGIGSVRFQQLSNDVIRTCRIKIL